MKTTVEIDDTLARRARLYAKRHGRSLRSLIEEGLRLCLDSDRGGVSYTLEDLGVGDRAGANPLEQYTWQELRDEIYQGR